MSTNRPLARIISLDEARFRRHVDEALALSRRPLDLLIGHPRGGSAHIEGGRVVVHCVASLTPDAAEALARQLYIFAAEAREGRHG